MSQKSASLKNNTKTSSKKSPNNKGICAAIRSKLEPHLQCLMHTKNGEKYCAMHSIQKDVKKYSTKYVAFDDDILLRDESIEPASTIVVNNVVKRINLDKISKNVPVVNKKKSIKTTTKVSTFHEQKKSTMDNDYQENEDDLEIKLLILANDEQHQNKIAKMIGPVFKDVTLSEDEQDPITFDKIWVLENGKRRPASVNKYYLFSYVDVHDKIRCLTIFTVNDMIINEDYSHPLTTEPIPKADIKRAKELIQFYKTNIGFFREDESKLTPEYKLKNRITKLFKQFHIHSIYLEERWLMDIVEEDKLIKIIHETEKIATANSKLINANLTNFKIFQFKKNKTNKSKKKSSNDEDEMIELKERIVELKEYIVEEWEKLIAAADNSDNQLPIWILVSGLTSVVEEIKEKFPNLEFMN